MTFKLREVETQVTKIRKACRPTSTNASLIAMGAAFPFCQLASMKPSRFCSSQSDVAKPPEQNDPVIAHLLLSHQYLSGSKTA